MGVSNKITAMVNLAAMIASILIIAAGVWFSSKPAAECVHQLRWFVTIIGIIILLVSLAGFVGAYWNRQFLLVLYLFSMAALIAILLVILVGAFIVTRSTGAYSIEGRGFYEYREEGFSDWLRSRVHQNWDTIHTCLSHSDVCLKLGSNYVSADRFFMSPLSPIESGCCKPPTMCGYTYVNAMTWTNPVAEGADPDCIMWSNDPRVLCYGCGSCRAGLMGGLRHEWKKISVFLIIALVILIWVYLIACSAFKNAQTEALFDRYKQGWT